MDGALGAVVTITTAIVGVAIVAVLMSKNSNTAGVIQSYGGAVSSMLSAATGPVNNVGGFGLQSFA